MPAIAGVFENNSFRLQVTGSYLRANSNSITVVVLDHQTPTTEPSHILAAYQRGGPQAVHQRTSDCAVVLVDESIQQLILSRDAIGMHPLHYRVCPSRFCFATRIDDVIRASGAVRPARTALAQQLIHGLPLEPGETYFDDVYSVPPGCTLVVRDGRTRMLRCETPVPAQFDNESFSAATAEFADLFAHAVSRRLDADRQSAVFVSGGLDSAAIICCADPQSAFGITYGPNDGSRADERRYVDALRARGYMIKRVDFEPIVDAGSIERNVRATENPFADDVPATLERAAQAAVQFGASAVLLGTWGDQVLAPFPPPHMQKIAPWRVHYLWRQAVAFQRQYSDVGTRDVFQAFMRNSLRARLPHRWIRRWRARRRQQTVFDLLARECGPITPALAAVSFSDAVHAAVSDAAHASALESTVKWGLANHIEVRLPFLDRALTDWLRSVPDDIAYHNSELKPLLRAGLRDRLPPEIANRRDKGDYTEAVAAGMLTPSDALDSLDGLRRLVDFGLMSRESARRTLAELSSRANIAQDTRVLASGLLAVDAWLREFFEAR
jgi:asparagine synthase (glutamine-hydrolysing)